MCYNESMQTTELQKTKTVRISKNNYDKVVAAGRYGQTFDSILSTFLEQKEAENNK